VLLEPFLPGAEQIRLPDRVVRNAASVEAVSALADRRIMIDCRSSLRRQGIGRGDLPALRRALGGRRPEGFTVHLPIDRPRHADPVREIADWVTDLREAGLEVPVMYASHLTGAELGALRTRFPGTRFRLRIGTDLWLGDSCAIQVRATVLDALPVTRGDRLGYRQRRARHGGWIVVVSGGTVHGVGLEAPKTLRGLGQRAKEIARSGMRAMNRTLSPFSWQGRRQWFAEPPHMSVSMIHLPGPCEPPEPGTELVAELRHTATHFDRVTLVDALRPRHTRRRTGCGRRLLSDRLDRFDRSDRHTRP
jgi:hypothetical protein